MEKEILFRNPALIESFDNSEFLDQFTVALSQISFSKKTLIEQHVLMIGDAAGMIAPLCGNGMSMALHASKIAVLCIDGYLQNKWSRKQMEKAYEQQWKKQFSSRLRAGRLLQGFFGSDSLSNGFVALFKTFPFLAKSIIRKTHGRAF